MSLHEDDPDAADPIGHHDSFDSDEPIPIPIDGILDQIPWVTDYRFANDSSSWGATIVSLR
jgi:hypothetical protein